MDAIIIHKLTKSAVRSTPAENPQARQALSRLGAVPGRSVQPRSAVRNITLRVQPGECLGVLGPHDAGKTTLLHLISGELQPDAGSVRVFGWDTVQDAAMVSRLVSPVLLDSNLLDGLSPLNNLIYMARLSGVYAYDTSLNCRTWLSLLGLDHPLIDEPLANLPLSARSKVALACALLSPAHVLLLDDPFAGMDPCDRQQSWMVVQKYRQHARRTIILTSREAADVSAVCDQVAVLENGHLEAFGAASEVLLVEPLLAQDCFALMA